MMQDSTKEIGHVVLADGRVTIPIVVDCWCFCARSLFCSWTWPPRPLGTNESRRSGALVKAGTKWFYNATGGRSGSKCRTLSATSRTVRPAASPYLYETILVKAWDWRPWPKCRYCQSSNCQRWSSHRGPRNMSRPTRRGNHSGEEVGTGATMSPITMADTVKEGETTMADDDEEAEAES
jgi:hypothetical protein